MNRYDRLIGKKPYIGVGTIPNPPEAPVKQIELIRYGDPLPPTVQRLEDRVRRRPLPQSFPPSVDSWLNNVSGEQASKKNKNKILIISILSIISLALLVKGSLGLFASQQRDSSKSSTPAPVAVAKDTTKEEKITVEGTQIIAQEFYDAIEKFGREMGYMEGQKDALKGRICVAMKKDSIWVWAKNPWDSTFSQKINYQPSIGYWKSVCNVMRGLKGVEVK